jgi:hypothetical protein
MSAKIPKAMLWTAESLNEYADMIDAGQLVPGHTPAYPSYWFNRLARETAGLWTNATLAGLLNDNARRELAASGFEVAARQ